MKLSAFGKKITTKSGISVLMDDLGAALAAGSDMVMLGGGNPAHIPRIEGVLRDCMNRALADPGRFERMVGDYDPPTGNAKFVSAVANLLKKHFGWPITSNNICLTNGSQTAFFALFNMFAGRFEDGSRKKILLPLAPEYIGYTDVGLTEDLFVAYKPEIEILPDHLFKYRVDFDAIRITEEIGAICVSRPTNPTGNVLTNCELNKLADLAGAHNIPLIIDNAYGAPFPDIIFTDADPIYNDNTIVCMSLSKLGLPAARTGIVVASKEIIAAMAEFNAVMSLAPGGLGAAMVTDLFASGKIIEISRDVIHPYYQEKAQMTVDLLRSKLDGIDFHIHKPEGAFFLWLWFPGLTVSSQTLYEVLKDNGVLVVPGHYFFPGLDDDWNHKQQCIRLNYAGDEAAVAKGIDILASQIQRLC
ncbi:MAG: valine--pyruvate transaminase [Sedimentisphaerales bacterium]|nr:valine--pyruvate transaminase [Sedimentisphaerales bacterium]